MLDGWVVEWEKNEVVRSWLSGGGDFGLAAPGLLLLLFVASLQVPYSFKARFLLSSLFSVESLPGTCM